MTGISDLTVKKIEVRSEEMPKIEDKPANPVTGAPQETFWDDTTTHLLVDAIATAVRAVHNRGGEIIQARSQGLAHATTPVLNKYFPTGWGAEMVCALAWSGVALEILDDMRKTRRSDDGRNKVQ